MKQNLIKNLGLQGVKGPFQGASMADIVEAEKKLNLRLPDDYRRFLQEFGASLFTEDVVFTPIEPSPWTVDGNECFDVFYGISVDPGFDLCRANNRLKGDIPVGTIAVGYDSGSNQVLLSVDTNQIRFFDKETGRTFLIAASFTDFLKSFHRREQLT
jgi:SMI1-KNR4 cell-wall